jgi:excisionase family DNA binding protein
MAQEQAREDLLTTQQLAERLQVSVPTVKRWRREGGGPPFVRAGRSVRYRAGEVDRWLEQGGGERREVGGVHVRRHI